MKFLDASGLTHLWGRITSTFQPKITATGVLKGNGSGGVTTAVGGTDYANASHSHGNITSGGDITASADIASGDRLVINDESASKITNSSLTFGTNDGTFLRKDGQWGTPDGTFSLPTASASTKGGVKVGAGLKMSGEALAHSNSITAGTAGTSSATSGSSLDVPYITYDANGHVTGKGTHTHTVTGFAASTHNHNASDINNGTLPVSRGGTGRSTMTYKNALPVGSNTNDPTAAMGYIRSQSGALYSTGQDVKPVFGALPVAQGGTGRTDFADVTDDVFLGAWALSGSSIDGFMHYALNPTGRGTFTVYAVRNNTTESSTFSSNTELPTAQTLRYALNRTNGVAGADTNYTTYMARGIALYAADSATYPTSNGCIVFNYA